MKRSAGIFLGFLCIGVSLAACPRGAGNPPVVQPLPPVVDGASCLTAVVVRSEDVCTDMFTPSGLACVRCAGGDGCISRDLMIYCVVGHICAADPLCARSVAPPPRR